jgi:peptidoglycan/xylan/chitin deacetylase (PgdA/CDA1 family)
VISLDFELHWGRFDKISARDNKAYYQMARNAVPRLLKMFEAYSISCTWATVGMLLLSDREEWMRNLPRHQAEYQAAKYSAYHWYEREEVDGSILFAPELVGKILEYQGQELGCHTFSHYYTMENGNCAESFSEDLQMAKKIVKDKLGAEMSSLVFPRNQYDENAISIASREGFTAVRTNPGDWYWRAPHQHQLLKKVFRSTDALLPLGEKSSYPISSILPLVPGEPYRIPASRFFRPYQPMLPQLNQWKLKRIKEEMTAAAERGEVYHLWWHPHNHGSHPEETFWELEHVLKHFETLYVKKGMKSANMKSLTHEIKT